MAVAFYIAAMALSFWLGVGFVYIFWPLILLFLFFYAIYLGVREKPYHLMTAEEFEESRRKDNERNSR